MKNLIIINAGNFGREVHAWARQTREHGSEWRIKGFLDNRKDILKDFRSYPPIISAPEEYEPEKDDLFTCAIGYPKDKKKFCEIILKKGGKFTNVIHPTVVMGENVKIGTGVILCPYVVIASDIRLGDFATINFLSSLGHDVEIREYCQVNANVSLNGSVRLKEGVSVGSNSVLIPGVVAEEFSVIGAGSVVLGKVDAYQTVFGSPARPFIPKENISL
jgi:sugar O-acyltransferase (sialic acid O-acetyltransferase NeuD family)